MNGTRLTSWLPKKVQLLFMNKKDKEKAQKVLLEDKKAKQFSDAQSRIEALEQNLRLLEYRQQQSMKG